MWKSCGLCRRVVRNNKIPFCQFSTAVDGETNHRTTETGITADSDNTEEKFVLPQPFLDPKILEYRRGVSSLYHANEEMYRNRAYTDDEAHNWSDYYPTVAPFDPYTLPFPLRMGKQLKLCLQPDKFVNLELMKVQNFLHATPPTVKKQCQALKGFCTKFPEGLDTDEKCEEEFPVDVHTVDYIAAAKNPRDSRSRVVTKKIRLCNLVLDSHARSKLIQIVGKKRYDQLTDILTLESNRCPLRKQNMDYVDYLLTALYFESWKIEKWENADTASNSGSGELFWWAESKSYDSLKRIIQAKRQLSANYSENDDVQQYSEAVKAVKLEPAPLEKCKFTPERSELIEDYRSSVLHLLDLPPLPSEDSQSIVSSN